MNDKDTGGPAFPISLPGMGDNGASGMTLRDYAAIKFAASWAIVLGSKIMNESRDQCTAEANRLGLLQADNFIKARSE